MDFAKKTAEFVSRSTRSRTARILIVLILVSAISLTVIVAQQQQTLKQRAWFFGFCLSSNGDADCACNESCQDSTCHSYYDAGYPGTLIQSFCESTVPGNPEQGTKTGRECMSGAHIATDQSGRNGMYTDWICDGSNSAYSSVCSGSAVAGYVIAECSATCGFTTLLSWNPPSSTCVRTDSISSAPTPTLTPIPTIYVTPTTYIVPTTYATPTTYIPPYVPPTNATATPTSYIPPTAAPTQVSAITLVSALNAQDASLTSDSLSANLILYNLTTNNQVSGAPATQIFNKTSIPGRQYSTNITLTNLNQDKYFIIFRRDNMIAKSVFTVSGSSEAITAATTTLVFGDLNNDNTIDIADYNIFRGCWKQTAIGSCASSDFNNSGGAIDQIDYNTWLRGFATWTKEAQSL